MRVASSFALVPGGEFLVVAMISLTEPSMPNAQTLTRAADTLREACEGGTAEIGAHLHPWNTPPLTEAFVPRNSMTKNLSPALQLAKIQQLTRTLEDAFGARPRSFRAGRYGLGADTISALTKIPRRTV